MREERYRLIYKGEILEGQNVTEVKQKLSDVLKLSEQDADKLFSGKSVVLKRNTSSKSAVRFQALFKSVGGWLRVQPVDADGNLIVDPDEDSSSRRSQNLDDSVNNETESIFIDPEFGFGLSPQGSHILDEKDRPVMQPVDIDTRNLDFTAEVGSLTPEGILSGLELAPTTEHISVADIGVEIPYEYLSVEIDLRLLDVDWELVDLGDRMFDVPDPPKPVIDLNTVNFELAAPGTPLGDSVTN